MKKRSVIIAVLVLAILAMSTSAVFAKGGKNGVYIRFYGSGEWKDSYWMKTGSGLVHEWRTTDSRHFVFKPVEKFDGPDCDPENLLNAFTWTAHAYPEDTAVSEGTMSDFLNFGSQYHVCMYSW